MSGDVDADIETASPVLGLRPVRAGLLLMPKVPNPAIRTSLPLARASPITANTPSHRFLRRRLTQAGPHGQPIGHLRLVHPSFSPAALPSFPITFLDPAGPVRARGLAIPPSSTISPTLRGSTPYGARASVHPGAPAGHRAAHCARRPLSTSIPASAVHTRVGRSRLRASMTWVCVATPQVAEQCLCVRRGRRVQVVPPELSHSRSPLRRVSLYRRGACGAGLGFIVTDDKVDAPRVLIPVRSPSRRRRHECRRTRSDSS